MNYDDMPEGAEMDRLVAERVMGFTFDAESGDYFLSDGSVFQASNGDFRHWQPSDNIAHAWEIVRHMQDLGKSLHLTSNDSGLWRSYFVYSGWSKMACDCDTAPLAICRAALKAVS